MLSWTLVALVASLWMLVAALLGSLQSVGRVALVAPAALERAILGLGVHWQPSTRSWAPTARSRTPTTRSHHLPAATYITDTRTSRKVSVLPTTYTPQNMRMGLVAAPWRPLTSVVPAPVSVLLLSLQPFLIALRCHVMLALFVNMKESLGV